MNVHLVWRYAPDRREVGGLLVYESGGGFQAGSGQQHSVSKARAEAGG